jgi:PAS domain S-box-containing protein
MFKKFKNSIVGKIMSGYAAIILLAFITTLVSMYSAWQNRKIDQLVSEVYYPMVLSLKETEMMASESFKLTNNWIYQPSLAEKEKLRNIHAKEAAVQKQKLTTITGKLDNSVAGESQAIQAAFDELLTQQQLVMDQLASDSSYSNDKIVDEAIVTMDSKITPAHEHLDGLVTAAIAHLNQLLTEAKLQKQASSNLLFYLYISNIILFLAIGIYASRFSRSFISRPIAELSNLITMLSQGKFVSVTLKKSSDEIGRMAEALENMLTGLKGKVEFAENIGKGNYESDFELLSADDTMGQALIQMRNNLKQAADEDRKRNWATEGLAKFADILQSRNEDLAELSDSIISNLVKYMAVNQGALFLINDDDAQNTFIELAACYAYDRRKFISKRIEIGEGLTGQCILEKDTIYMSDIPDNYLKITSGLGEALPRNLLIVPLKINDSIFGVVEIASFKSIETYQIDFVEKLGESIASTISSVKTNGRTKKLLEETQIQAEQMRAQEEEMRQNMEELSATQEEMHRAQRRSDDALQEIKDKEKILYARNEEFEFREKIIGLTTLLSETDLHGNITYVNEKVCEISRYKKEELLGEPHSILRHEDMPAELFKRCWTALKKGSRFQAILKNKARTGDEYWVDVTITPVKNKQGEIAKFVSIGYPIADHDLAVIRYNRQATNLNLPQMQDMLAISNHH